MGKFSILLCDSDEIYAKRLARELQRQFREQVSVKIFSDSLSTDEKQVQGDLFLGDRLPKQEWRERHRECACICLDAGDEANLEQRRPDIWKGSIFKYQPASKIARDLQRFFPIQIGIPINSGLQTQQIWYGVLSPTRHGSMIPFACTLASCLRETRRVLLMVLMEFSGIVSLLGLQPGQGMETFLFQLRQGKSLEEIPLPPVQVLDEFDLLEGPKNPMVLYELNERDIQNLIRRIQMCKQYDAVIWLSGNMFRGTEELIRQSEQVICVEKSDPYSRCCQEEFQDIYKKLKLEEHRLCHIKLPTLAGSQTGGHLLWQWKHSAIGEVAQRVLKGETFDGTDCGIVSKEDYRTDGSEWRNIRPGSGGDDSGTD